MLKLSVVVLGPPFFASINMHVYSHLFIQKALTTADAALIYFLIVNVNYDHCKRVNTENCIGSLWLNNGENAQVNSLFKA